VKDPGPNLLEQIIKSNELLAAILAGGDVGAGPATLQGGAVPAQWPILLYWSNQLKHGFTFAATQPDTALEVKSDNGQMLSADTVLYMSTGAAGNIGDSAQMDMLMPPPVSGHVRLQMAFTSPRELFACDWYVSFELYDGVNLNTTCIRLKAAPNALAYKNSAGAYIDLKTNAYTTTAMEWNKLDWVINFDETKYHWLSCQHNQFDMSSLGLQQSADAHLPVLNFRFQIKNVLAASEAEAIIDEILITDELYSGPA